MNQTEAFTRQDGNGITNSNIDKHGVNILVLVSLGIESRLIEPL